MQERMHRSKSNSIVVALSTFFLVAGMGQVFGGRFSRGLSFFGLSLLLSLLSNSMPFMTFVLIAFLIYVAYDAYQININPEGIELQWYNEWYYYALMVLGGYVLQVPIAMYSGMF